MKRSFLAVVIGFVVTVLGLLLFTALVAKLLPSILPAEGQAAGTGYLLLSLLCLYGFAVLGGYVAGWIALRAPALHALALAAVMGILVFSFIKVNAGQQPKWYEYGLLAATIPTLIGGWLRARGAQKRAALSTATTPQIKLQSIEEPLPQSPPKPKPASAEEHGA